MEASEFRATHIKGFAETECTKDVKVPKKKDDNTFIGDNVLQATVDGTVQENTSRSEVVQIDKNKATGFPLNGSELDDGNNSFESSEKDEMDIVISELVSNITRDAFENLGQEYLFQNYNTYQITPEDIESICKSTLESIQWPRLTKEIILSRPIPSSPSGNEFGDEAKTSKKEVSEENTSQYQSHMIAEQFLNNDMEENEVKPTKISSDFTSKSSASGSVYEHATNERNTGHIMRVAHFLRSKFIKVRKFFRSDSKKEDSQKRKSSST